MRKRPTLNEVLRHRAQLVERAQAQRGQIAGNFEALQGVASWIDRGVAAGAYLRTHPLALAGIGLVAMLVLRRPLRSVGLLVLLRRGLVAWRTVATVRSIAYKLAR